MQTRMLQHWKIFETSYLSSSHMLSIFLLARCWVKYDVINGLYQFQLHHTFNQEAGKEFLI